MFVYKNSRSIIQQFLAFLKRHNKHVQEHCKSMLKIICEISGALAMLQQLF